MYTYTHTYINYTSIKFLNIYVYLQIGMYVTFISKENFSSIVFNIFMKTCDS